MFFMAINFKEFPMSNENKILSKSAQSVQQALAEKGLIFEVVELAASTRTAMDAAETIGCNVAQIMKSLLFCTAKTRQPVLILASGVNRVNEQIIEQYLGERIIKADADFTREITGFAIGGVPPIGHKQVINRIFIDEDLLQHPILWAAAGTPNAVFSLSSGDIESLTHGKTIAIK
jgi:prolyl-tRNA editing enzyme YbaK/EbsC (Cys-tRNA(Pro) deacylase)